MLTGVKYSPNGMFMLVIGLKIGSKEVDGGRCVRGSDEKLCFGVKEIGNAWKHYMVRIIYKDNDRDHKVDSSVVCASRDEDQLICSKDQLICSKDQLISIKDQVICSKDQVIRSKDQLICSNDQVICSKDQLLCSYY